ncbi:MAG TPA: carbohydrate ABC transporter permease [Thermomicrobiales bacterium]|nr:carbohydrate ABC transporter permease [Thermomicrobiales bacterium]
MSATTAGRPKARRRGLRGWDAVVLVGLTFFVVLWLAPLVSVVFTAVRSRADLAMNGVYSLPQALVLDNFVRAWDVGGFGTYFGNSLLVTLTKVPLGIGIAALAAYPLAKLRFRFDTPVFILFLVGLAIPIHVALVPLFTTMRQIGWLNSLAALYPPYIAFGLPFQILVLRGFFDQIPDEVVSAARVDGASEFEIFWRIVLPLSLPVLATLFIIDALHTWNELLIALVMLSSESLRTVPLGLLNFQGQYSSDFTLFNAGILIAIAPILLLYITMQRYVVSGLTAGALKE